jgi:hypothetical protein
MMFKQFSLLVGTTCLVLAQGAAVHAMKKGPPGKAAESKNMRLVGHNDLQARSAYKGHVQKQGDRYIAYVGHHGGEAFNPLTGEIEGNGVSIVDVTNPKKPVYLHHLTHPNFSQSRNLQTCSGKDLTGDNDNDKYYLLREVQGGGNGAHEVYDVTDPANPVKVATVQDGITGTHKNWWECSTGIAYLTSGVPGWSTRVMSIFDLSDPANPLFIRNYIGLPGMQPGGDPTGLRDTDVHEPLYMNGRVYMAHGTRADGIFQILDNDKLLQGDPGDPYDPLVPTDEQLLFPVISRLDWPDFQGVHTAVPLLDMDVSEFADFNAGSPRDMVAVINESTRNECNWDMHQMVYMVDITDPAHPIPVSTYYVPEKMGNFCERGGRFGAHSMQWNLTEKHYHKRIIFVSYFNAGVRAVDIRDPYNPKEVGFYIPAITENTDPRDGKKAIQTNNVDVDGRGYVYTFDRANTGMHILGVTGQLRKIAHFNDDDDSDSDSDSKSRGRWR